MKEKNKDVYERREYIEVVNAIKIGRNALKEIYKVIL